MFRLVCSLPFLLVKYGNEDCNNGVGTLKYLSSFIDQFYAFISSFQISHIGLGIHVRLSLCQIYKQTILQSISSSITLVLEHKLGYCLHHMLLKLDAVPPTISSKSIPKLTRLIWSEISIVDFGCNVAHCPSGCVHGHRTLIPCA